MGCNSSSSTSIIDSTSINTPQPNPNVKTTERSAKKMTSATQKHTYKLTYFDFYGRAEITRLVFAAGNIEYEDHRVQFEDWAEFKKTMPTEKVPVLEIDGKHALVQSIAIARFAAKEANLYGRNTLETAKIDAVIDTAGDLGKEYTNAAIVGALSPNKDEILSKFVKDILPTHLRNLEKLIAMYGSDGFFVGNQLTLADLSVYDLINNVIEFIPNLLDNFASLKRNRETVESVPLVNAYLAKRKPNLPVEKVRSFFIGLHLKKS